MDPKVVSREIVKPSSNRNDHHPKIHNLSFFDQLAASVYMPLLFFYTTTTQNGEPDNDHRSSRVLKDSLSLALSRYYPLAGRIKDDIVHCNDEGALFIEATMDANLSEILKNPDDEILKPLFPDSLYFKDSTRIGPVVVQVTYFKCGGMSIGLCLCHTSLDMASMGCFIRDWASLARDSEAKISPMFDLGSLYPPLDLPILKQKHENPTEMKDCVTRRVVFDGSKIAKLKELVADDQVPNPTRVEVVTSLLYKAAVSANAKATGCLKPSIINYAMNFRTRVSPPLSERNIGNMAWSFPVSSGGGGVELELGLLVKEFRKAKNEFSNSCANISKKEDLCSLILKNVKSFSEYFSGEYEPYSCTSWCRYPFYESDFGWGKPLWVATVPFKLKNVISLIDTKEGDGIEAFICLQEKTMSLFQNDQELLSFFLVDPIVLDE